MLGFKELYLVESTLRTLEDLNPHIMIPNSVCTRVMFWTNLFYWFHYFMNDLVQTHYICKLMKMEIGLHDSRSCALRLQVKGHVLGPVMFRIKKCKLGPAASRDESWRQCDTM